MARLLDEHQDQVAGMIIEPVMMNAGIIKPAPGYLASLKALLHSREALLTFDEVKTGLTVGPGGVTRAENVQPDLITLAKSLGGGVSVAAIGGTEGVMDHVASGRLRDGGHLQREPAGHGRDPGYADRGGHAGGVREESRRSASAPPAAYRRPSTTTG